MAERVRRRKGVSLAKGPAGLIGLVALAYGVLALILGGHGLSMSPGGDVVGSTWLGIEGNGWTNLLFAVGGALLVLSAPMHWGAKTMSLLVGGAFVAAGVLTLVDGDDVFGIFAANAWTVVAWLGAGAVLLAVALMPRVGRRDEYVVDRDAPPAGRRFRRDGADADADAEDADVRERAGAGERR